MKIPTKPIAAAVSLALLSVSAHAALAPPTLGTAAPTSDGLYLSIWDSAGTNSEIVNLSYLDSAITTTSGALAPNSATSPFATATNPATGSGSVLQLNFGTIPDFSTLFTSANIGTTDYMLTAAHSISNGGQSYAEVTSANTPVTAYTGMTGLINNVQGEIANWNTDDPASGVVTDTTGTSNESVQNGLLKGGQLISGQQFGGSAGSALGFYDLQANSSTHKLTTTPYANATGAGFWYLSTAGILSYDVPLAASAVPLPPAVWLFGGGLLGLIGIGRRRAAV